MSRRSTILVAGVAVFALVQVAGGGYAIGMGERRHAAVHGVLLVVAAVAAITWLLATRTARRETSRLPEGDQRIDYLQQSIDAVALEVERIGEAQRFNEKLRAERGETPPPQKKLPEE